MVGTLLAYLYHHKMEIHLVHRLLLEFTVKDTGGYQNWIDVSLGEVDIAKPGDQELTVKVLKKARGIMDIRRIVLKPVR